jgi:hypothetical protein
MDRSAPTTVEGLEDLSTNSMARSIWHRTPLPAPTIQLVWEGGRDDERLKPVRMTAVEAGQIGEALIEAAQLARKG